MSKDFPPIGTVYSEDIDNEPLTVVIKDKNRYDALALTNLFQFRFALADSLFSLYLQNGDRNNLAVYGYIGIAKAMKGDVKAAMDYGQQSRGFDEFNFSGYLATGLAYLRNNESQKAFPYLAEAYSMTIQANYFTFVRNEREFVSILLYHLDPALMNDIVADLKKRGAMR